MRPEKANIVSHLSEELNRSPFLLVADYQRMKVDQFGELRNRLAPAGAQIRVVKNSFLKRAMADSGMPNVGDKLVGQTAIVMGESDVAPVAKILKLFAAEFKTGTLKVGVIDKAVLSISEVETLAELPAREVLLAQLLGLFLSPARRLVRLLNEPGSALARLLKARGEKLSTSSEPAAKNEQAPEAKQETAFAEKEAEAGPAQAAAAPPDTSSAGEPAKEGQA
jgi:large subunit ribosomal protein L10